MDLFHVWFKGDPYSAHVLISFWCDFDKKFLRLTIFEDISVLFILAIIEIS